MSYATRFICCRGQIEILSWSPCASPAFIFPASIPFGVRYQVARGFPMLHNFPSKPCNVLFIALLLRLESQGPHIHKEFPTGSQGIYIFFGQNNIAFATIYIRQSACILAWTMHRSETFWYIVPIKKINAFIISLCSLLENNRSLLISFFLFLRSRAWTIHGLRGWAEVLFLSPSFSSCFEEKLFHVADTHQQRLTQSGRYQVDSSEISTLWMWLNMIDIQDRYLIALK